MLCGHQARRQLPQVHPAVRQVGGQQPPAAAERDAGDGAKLADQACASIAQPAGRQAGTGEKASRLVNVAALDMHPMQLSQLTEETSRAMGGSSRRRTAHRTPHTW